MIIIFRSNKKNSNTFPFYQLQWIFVEKKKEEKSMKLKFLTVIDFSWRIHHYKEVKVLKYLKLGLSIFLETAKVFAKLEVQC